MLSKQTFRTIQSGKQDEWYNDVTNAALYIATGGFLIEANRLLKALWKYQLPHSRDTWLPDRSFETLWYVAGERPESVPFNLMNPDQLEIEHRVYCSGDSYVYKMPDVEWQQLTGKDAFRQASIFAQLINDELPGAEAELKSLQLLERSLGDKEQLAGYEICRAASLAAELAAKNEKQDIAIDMAKLWAVNYHDNWLSYSIPLMSCNRHVAPLLLKGVIAKELKLDEKLCKEFVNDAIDAMEGRINKGASLVYGELSWQEILEKLSALSIKTEPDMFTPEQKTNKWIGKEPASVQAIEEAEKRLGLKLPDDYKEFLKVSNGFPEFPLVNPVLASAEEINFLVEAYKVYENGILDITKDYPDEEKGTIGEYVERGIAISRFPAEQEVWLIPSEDGNEWECWFFASWIPGEDRYKSFRHYIEAKIQQLEED